jgi:hypothetical protein
MQRNFLQPSLTIPWNANLLGVLLIGYDYTHPRRSLDQVPLLAGPWTVLFSSQLPLTSLRTNLVGALWSVLFYGWVMMMAAALFVSS